MRSLSAVLFVVNPVSRISIQSIWDNVNVNDNANEPMDFNASCIFLQHFLKVSRIFNSMINNDIIFQLKDASKNFT